MDPLRPYDITKLIAGAARVAIGDADGTNSVTVPAKVQDVMSAIAVTGAYPLQTNWRDIGAAVDGSSYSHGRTTTGMEIQQETGAIMEEVTAVARSMAFNMAELDPTNIQFAEVASVITTIAAVAGVAGPQKSVGMGSYSELPGYRIALIGFRKLSAGVVTETVAAGGASRGRIVMAVLNRVTLSADAQTIALGKGTLANAAMGVTAFPEPGQPKATAYGRWIFEEAATIAAGP